MNQDNRVLARYGARELTPKEVDHVTGGIHTETVCSAPYKPGLPPDGDAGECGGY